MNIPETTRNIYAIGRNYAKHIEELGNKRPHSPIIFANSLASLTSLHQLLFPAHLDPIHHEVELVLRIGSHVAMGAYRDHAVVSHMGLGIDFTARGEQTRVMKAGLPWHMSKSFQSSCYLDGMTENFDMKTPFHFMLHINGALRQQGDSSHMIFSFDDMLTVINRTIAFHVGDLIYTGTPAGVGPVVAGDELRISCSELGVDQTLTVGFAV